MVTFKTSFSVATYWSSFTAGLFGQVQEMQPGDTISFHNTWTVRAGEHYGLPKRSDALLHIVAPKKK